MTGFNHFPTEGNRADDGEYDREHKSFETVSNGSTNSYDIGPIFTEGEVFEIRIIVSCQERTVGPMDIDISDASGSEIYKEWVQPYDGGLFEYEGVINWEQARDPDSSFGSQLTLNVQNEDGSDSQSYSVTVEWTKIHDYSRNSAETHTETITSESFDA